MKLLRKIAFSIYLALIGVQPILVATELTKELSPILAVLDATSMIAFVCVIIGTGIKTKPPILLNAYTAWVPLLLLPAFLGSLFFYVLANIKMLDGGLYTPYEEHLVKGFVLGISRLAPVTTTLIVYKQIREFFGL